jgi:GTPase Era involved in 16S rRNA processing
VLTGGGPGSSTTFLSQTLAQIKHLIEQEFLALAKTDDNSLSATAYVQLQQLLQQLSELAAFPHLEKYYTIAVGGSFSAGKSRFLNSVLGCPSLLPTDTTPTTSIPTYISQGNINSISALNFYRKKTTIDEEALKAICHAFNDKFSVTFSHLLQLISVERESFKYPNLVFLDTPGYSKADNVVVQGTVQSAVKANENNTNNPTNNAKQCSDENIAREHLTRADYLIWLVDQQNGTVPQHDIEFIKGLALNQPVLVVISKADKKTPSEIDKIIAAAKTSLDRADIVYLDVIAYSAKKSEEYSPTQKILTNLLTQISQGKSGSTVLWQLNTLFSNYINCYKTKHHELSLTNATLNELAFDEGISDENKTHFNDIKKKTKEELAALTRQQKLAEKIHLQLSEQIEFLCAQVGVKTTLKPSVVALKSLHKKQSDSKSKSNNSQSYSFRALIDGDSSQLANVADLSTLNGVIVKIVPNGVKINIDVPFDIFILKPRIEEQLGKDIQLDKTFNVGQQVNVQFIDKKSATITIELNN